MRLFRQFLDGVLGSLAMPNDRDVELANTVDASF